jgi:hypothetical protein
MLKSEIYNMLRPVHGTKWALDECLTWGPRKRLSGEKEDNIQQASALLGDFTCCLIYRYDQIAMDIIDPIS